MSSYAVPATAGRELPADRSIVARLTATYHPANNFNATLKVTIDHDMSGDTSWNDTLWKCPGGVNTFPGDRERCGDRFQVEHNPVPGDIAATRPDMARYARSWRRCFRQRSSCRLTSIFTTFHLTPH